MPLTSTLATPIPTKLAARSPTSVVPEVGQVLSLSLPSLNLPQRTQSATSSPSPMIHRAPKTPLSTSHKTPLLGSLTPTTSSPCSNRLSASVMSSLKDLRILASSANRAAKYRDEIHTRLRIGVLLDNHDKRSSAIKEYEACLVLSEHLEDRGLQSISLNALAVDYFKLGQKEVSKSKNSEPSRINFERSRDCSRQQSNLYDEFDVDDDAKSSQVLTSLYHSNTNFGISSLILEDFENALESLNSALKFALLLNDLNYERLATGNLILNYFCLKKFSEARVSYERFVQLSENLELKECPIVEEIMTRVSLNEGNFGSAKEQLKKSWSRCDSPIKVSMIKSSLGIVNGREAAEKELQRLSGLC
ncbi:hypothetical protein P9112_013743 [Eukaryota sp. TZLM1-RC]